MRQAEIYIYITDIRLEVRNESLVDDLRRSGIAHSIERDGDDCERLGHAAGEDLPS